MTTNYKFLNDKGSFPLRAQNKVFFVSFMDFFALLSAFCRLSAERNKIIKKIKNTLLNAGSGNKL